VRDLAHHKLWAQGIQQMLQQSLNIECNLRTTVESVWFDDIKSGNYDLAIGAIVSTPLDPSDYFNAWYTKDGPQNYSFWDNKEFQALVPRIDREVDAKKRLTLIRRAESVMEQDPPLVPVAWEKINDVWYNYVMDHNPPDYFGIYDVGQTGYSVAGQGLRYCSSPPRKRGSRSAAEPWIPEFPLSRE